MLPPVETENPWQTLASKPVYDNPWIQVTEFDVINPSGGKGIYGKVHFKNLAIGIVPLDAELNTYLVGQFRYTLNQYSWEIPEGGGPFGIEALESAKRELAEETGFIARDWSMIQEIHLSNSVSDEFGQIFLARDLVAGVATPEETEQLQVVKIPFAEAYRMVEENIITDSLSVAGILKVQLMLSDGRIK
ncbi:MAG: NUDIX hydrolase [Chitinophagaceae bacterium]|nr:MAG: NUDIX hydrolase [Chitinophagaceae bacterium]